MWRDIGIFVSGVVATLGAEWLIAKLLIKYGEGWGD